MFGPVKNKWHKILKIYQIQTRASVLTKEDFPSMSAELYEKPFLPNHFKSGFRKSGLHPLNREAIPSSKLAKSIPFTGKSASVSGKTLSGGQEKHSEQDKMVIATVNCNLEATLERVIKNLRWLSI